MRRDTLPNDTLFSQLWGLDNTGQSGGTVGADVHATEAWDTLQGSKTVVIASIDSGVDYNHEDLAVNMWHNPIPNDGSGFENDIYGINAVAGSSDPMDDNGHGTQHVGEPSAPWETTASA